MDFRKLLLIVLAAFFAWQAAALTIEELQEHYYQSEDGAGFSLEAEAFIEANEDLDELKDALWMWIDLDPGGCVGWLEAKIETEPDEPKYRYLGLGTLDGQETRRDNILALIGSHPGFAGGYRALLFHYFQDYELEEINDPESDSHQLLLEDLPLLQYFGANFQEDKYSSMARVYHIVQSGNVEAAKEPLREALENKDTWIEDFGLTALFTPDKYHPLLAYQIELMRADDSDEYTKYGIATLAGDLVDYHFDQVQDYEAVIDYFGEDPWYWENLYVIYALAESYLALDQPENAVILLNGNNDLPMALQFQNSWLAFDAEGAAAAYSEVLQPVADLPLHAYLLARSQPDPEARLIQARALAASHPREEFGYSLAAEVYLNHFSESLAGDEEPDRFMQWLENDSQILRNYYFRFPDNNLAKVGYFLVNVLDKDGAKALRTYQELHSAGLGDLVTNNFFSFALDNGQSDLLRQINAYELRQDELNGELSDAELQTLANQRFCLALYDNGLYGQAIAEVAKNPDWMDDQEIQYLVLNAHYSLNDYSQTIATLRLMVEKGTIGASMLADTDDPDLTEHPDWQALLDYAATLPDPDAASEQDSEAPEE